MVLRQKGKIFGRDAKRTKEELPTVVGQWDKKIADLALG